MERGVAWQEKRFDRAEEFADADFNGARLEKRLARTMETLSRQPGSPIWANGKNRAEAASEAAAVYRGDSERVVFLIRVTQNRLTAGNGKIREDIRKSEVKGRVTAYIPRDSRRKAKGVMSC